MNVSWLCSELRLITGSAAVDCCVARPLLPKDHHGACELNLEGSALPPTRSVNLRQRKWLQVGLHDRTNAGPRFPPPRFIRRLPAAPAALADTEQASDNA